MKHYWYFASTLTSFPFGSPPPISMQAFDELCSRMMDKSDLEILPCVEEARNGRFSAFMEKSAFLMSYFEFERGLRNALVVFRTRASKQDASQWTRPGDINPDSLKAAQAAQAASDPLQAELAIERERWNATERLSALSAFELDSILAYKMKLLIASRYASFDRNRGIQGFNILYQDIINAAVGAASAFDTGVAT
ncbi:MAG: hypothetical protein BWX81_02371 [Spirochaetes bacterium ADurb.Bin110]|nr:MAG: hypothetical protein BWX81_02371 [Spirochaetes bacterium ADurb.Bin110]